MPGSSPAAFEQVPYGSSTQCLDFTSRQPEHKSLKSMDTGSGVLEKEAQTVRSDLGGLKPARYFLCTCWNPGEVRALDRL